MIEIKERSCGKLGVRIDTPEGYEHKLCATRNGYQWTSINMDIDLATLIIGVLSEYVSKYEEESEG